MEIEREKVSWFKNKKIWIGIAGVAVILSIFYTIGYSGAKAVIDDEKVTYDELVSKIGDKEKELKEAEATLKEREQEIKNEISELEKQFEDRKSEFDEALAAVENKKQLETEIKSLESTKSGQETSISNLTADIKAKREELAKIEDAIVEKNEAPVQLPAGQFVVGKDIKPGRYKVLPVGRGANFFVFDQSGNNIVNTIIYSDSSLGVTEYVTLLDEGYVIDAASPFKYVPVE
ncbi:hypothetical protein PUS82_15170 [Cytobacillus firmus]|uniref:hypothetical protein n=1 Tax=Cytobacillus firmus TaxID=1399 RepID=UPI00237BB535|nr:hypothetical protein [Cytobacillus firmus]MDD9312614.1 hypothetical protein [Cytobacillus firmus]